MYMSVYLLSTLPRELTAYCSPVCFGWGGSFTGDGAGLGSVLPDGDSPFEHTDKFYGKDQKKETSAHAPDWMVETEK